MASLRLGSKPDAFQLQRQGQAWFCTNGLPSDVIVEVGEMSFHLHKFPLISRSAIMEKLIGEASKKDEEECKICLYNIPGGSKTFELVARFCYGVKLELTAANVVHLRCTAEFLEMSEDYGEGNLIVEAENFLTQVVLKSWKDSVKVLQTCDDALPHAEDLGIIEKCINSLATKASTDPNLFGWPMMEHGPMHSPGGSVLWNGISTGARQTNCSSDWWYEDVSCLNLSIYKRLMLVIKSRDIRPEVFAGCLAFYAKKYLPGLHRRQTGNEMSTHIAILPLTYVPTEEEQKVLLEEIDTMLPVQKGLVPTKFLLGLLRTAMILQASSTCVANLEKRIGMQLDQATMEDLLLPTFSYSMETLYNVDCVQRILKHFLALDQVAGEASPYLQDEEHSIVSPSLAPITAVAKLIDGFLAEVAPDANLKLPRFQSLAGSIPDFARPLDDGLYRAIDIYLKSHPWLSNSDCEQLCRLMDCQKLSLEACMHAAQNERLPLRVVVQVLFFEQLQLRSSIAGCFLASDNLDGSRPLRSGCFTGSEACGIAGEWVTAARENHVLKVSMDSMRMRVAELENECSIMKQEIQKLGHLKGGNPATRAPKKFSFRIKSQMCSAQEGAISEHKSMDNVNGKVKRLQLKLRHKKNM